jgi:hypothetical protein
VSESSISASLETMVVVLLKEMSRDSEELPILGMNDLRKHPLAIPISGGSIPLLA